MSKLKKLKTELEESKAYSELLEKTLIVERDASGDLTELVDKLREQLSESFITRGELLVNIKELIEHRDALRNALKLELQCVKF